MRNNIFRKIFWVLSLFFLSLLMSCSTPEGGSGNSDSSQNIDGGTTIPVSSLKASIPEDITAFAVQEEIATGKTISNSRGGSILLYDTSVDERNRKRNEDIKQKIDELNLGKISNDEFDNFLKKSGLNSRSSGKNSGSNLLSIRSDGSMGFVISSDYSVKVAYTVSSPDNRKFYAVIDLGASQWELQQALRGCNLLEIDRVSGEIICIEPKAQIDTWDYQYNRQQSDDRKPIKFDGDGNVYYKARPMEVDEWGNVQPSWDKQFIRKYDVSTMTTKSVTSDALDWDTFQVLEDGNIFASGWGNNGQYSLWLFKKNGGENEIIKNVKLYTSDSSKTLLYGQDNWNWGGGGLYAMRLTDSGYKQAFLDTTLISNQRQPERLYIGDDGVVYGLFYFEEWDSNNNRISEMKIYSILPYDPAPKASVNLESEDWWSFAQSAQIQIANGYLYYQSEKLVRGQGYQDILNATSLATGKTLTLFENGSRYDIYRWKITNGIMYVSARDLDKSIVVSAEIDTNKLKRGSGENEYLSIKESASAVGDISAIKDIEIVKPIEPESPTGIYPQITKIFSNNENPSSIGFQFTNYMDKESVEDNFKLNKLIGENSDEDQIKGIPVWIYTTMHYIIDRNIDGEINPDIYTPFVLEYGENYRVVPS